jgi:predicted alpha-1,2-mannosidase
MGGNDRFISRLDSLFTLKLDLGPGAPPDVSGLIGLYAHGNEPSHHIAYLYAAAGKPAKTQKMVRQIMRTLYNNTNAGLCGNEDCGQMSAWYVFSALGFYPLNPADGKYYIGSPLVKKATLKLDNGKTFTIDTKDQAEGNVYIKQILLNGKILATPFITHQDIMDGGTLEFVMSDKQ